MIGRVQGNEILAMDCQHCPQPILVGHTYHVKAGNGGPPSHYLCWLTDRASTRPVDIERIGLDR